MRNILLINDIMSGGGAERSMAIIANELAKVPELNINLLSLEDSFGYELNDSINIMSFSHKYRLGQVSKFLTMPLDAFRLKTIVQKNNIDTILAFQHRSNFIAGLARVFGCKVKTIVSERSYPRAYFSRGGFDCIAKWLIKNLYNVSDMVVCNGSETKDSLHDDFEVQVPVKVIPNSYSVQEILEKSKEAVDEVDKPIFQNKKKTIIYVSRMTDTKGHIDLLQAFRKLEGRLKYQIVFVGDGVEEKNIRNKIKELDLVENVHMVGRKLNPYSYLVRSDIFVMPSQYEGYPNALAEALICGLACVSYDFKAGARDLLGDNEAGTLVPIGDIDGLAKAITSAENKSDKARIYTKKELLEAYIEVLS